MLSDQKIKILDCEVSFNIYCVGTELMDWCVDFEASFLRLIEKVTNGTIIEISYTGKSPSCTSSPRCIDRTSS